MDPAYPISPARPEEQAEALLLVFRHFPRQDRQTRVANALSLLQRSELEPAGLLVARGPRGVLGALVCLPAPGASGLVWPPQVASGIAEASRIEDALVRHGSDWLRQRGARLAQALLNPEEASLAAPLERNGFLHITKLWYMRHGLERSAGIRRAGDRLTYWPYSRDPDRFHETLLRTYVESQDCPEVTGVRTIDEIITGHQAQGSGGADRWWLGWSEDRPVGVLLLTEMPEWNGWDISYVGVVPESRQHGHGRELVAKAIAEAQVAGAAQLTLSVDGRNQPALELYRSMGFEPYDQREVYLAIWDRASEE